MRYPILISIFLFTFLSACNKDKFQSTPSLKFKDVNTKTLQPGQELQFTISFTDAEGDLTDNLTVIKTVANCPASNFTQAYPLPAFPTSKNQKGDLLVTFLYSVGGLNTIKSPQCSPKDDTAVFKFVLKDKAQHISDTVASPTIIIIHQ